MPKKSKTNIFRHLPDYLQPRILSAVAFVNAVAPDFDKEVEGFIIVGPIIVVTYAVGGFWELIFAIVKNPDREAGVVHLILLG